MTVEEIAQLMATAQGRTWWVVTTYVDNRLVEIPTPHLHECSGYVSLRKYEP